LSGPRYRSSIPRDARERVTERYPNGAKREAEYRSKRKLVGVRLFFESGEPEIEYSVLNGKRHGMEYIWQGPHLLLSAQRFVHGLSHGIFKQCGHDGRLIGTYRMVRGTGIDLWRQQRDDGHVYLAEILYWKNGHRQGFEWWINEDQRSVYIERHWDECELHGIEREWNYVGRLSRGYPKYHIRGEQVTKRKYLSATTSDPTLPRFKQQDNEPKRTFPSEIVKHLEP
jgi:hypothetical protein